MRGRLSGRAGFTLIEMVIVILVAGILASLGAAFIVKPVTGYFDLSRRARLVDAAELALRRMQRDIRQALPNSIRIDASGNYLELLHTVDGGRYRMQGGDSLDLTLADNGFDVLGPLRQTPTVGDSVVIYNLSASGASGNAYASPADNRALVGAGSSTTHLVLDPDFQFARSSPYQRFFLVDEPVSYACEGSVLRRYAGYGITPAQATPPAAGGDLLARDVSACSFSYQPGTNQRAGLVTLELSLSRQGETISLLHQVHVVNAP